MKHIHTDSHTSEKGWKEITTYHRYFLDEATGDVRLEISEDCDNPYPGKESYSGREIGGRVLKPNEIPEIVRLKIAKLTKNEKS